MSEITTDPRTGLPSVDVGGVPRLLASIPSGGRMRAELTPYRAAHPVLPKSEWFEVSHRDICPWILDQKNHGSCVGNGWSAALRRARLLAGCKDVALSPAYLYSLINGGRDQGAIISDGIDALTQVGTCTYATVGQDPIYTPQMPAAAKAEAKRFRLKAAYHCSSWEEVISALLQPKPLIPVYGFMVGNTFMTLDRYGVAGHDSGPGNHCNHADGVKLLPDGRWVLDDVNSWGPSFGDGGRCYIDEQHLFGGGDQPDVCVIEAFVEDPDEPFQPPAYQP